MINLDIWKEGVSSWKGFLASIIIQVAVYFHSEHVINVMLCVHTHTGCGIRFDRESVTPDKLQRMMDTGMLRLLSNCHYSNTEKLGEVLIKTMLDEVSEFCKIDVQHSWTLQSRQQVHIVLFLFTLCNLFFVHS